MLPILDFWQMFYSVVCCMLFFLYGQSKNVLLTCRNQRMQSRDFETNLMPTQPVKSVSKSFELWHNPHYRFDSSSIEVNNCLSSEMPRGQTTWCNCYVNYHVSWFLCETHHYSLDVCIDQCQSVPMIWFHWIRVSMACWIEYSND